MCWSRKCTYATIHTIYFNLDDFQHHDFKRVARAFSKAEVSCYHFIISQLFFQLRLCRWETPVKLGTLVFFMA